MQLEQFCQGAKDNLRVQCLLDMPSIDGERPKFIKFLDNGHTAYFRLHNYYPSRKNIEIDVQRSASWVLIHQGLYHTFAHQDADGYSTWTQILSGYKFWTIIRPRDKDAIQNRTAHYRSASRFLDQEFNKEFGYYGEEFERTVIYGKPGDIIIMPPATFHEVYTPVPSVTLGGHFYTYNALHLTEMGRACDMHTSGRFTNQSHFSSSLTIALMMAALPLNKHLRKFLSYF